MTAPTVQQTQSSTASPQNPPAAPAASDVIRSAIESSTSCEKLAPLMLCEVYSYRKGLHDDGKPQLAHTSERCEACPWGE